MHQEQPLVYIIIVNYKGLEDTIDCINSLKNIEYQNYRIVVVDNNSEDGSAEKLDELFFDYVKIIKSNKNLGFAGGNNIGIRRALEENAEYALLLNNDTVVEPDFLNHLVNKAVEDKSIGCVGGKIYYYSSKDILWYAGAKINKYTGRTKHLGVDEKDIGQYSISKEEDYITGCLMLVKREVLEKVGLMDERYFLYYEETDWCAKIKKYGYKLIFEPKSVIYHKVSSSTKNINDVMKYYYDRNSYFFIINNYGILNRAFMFFYKRIFLFLKLIRAGLNKNKSEWEIIKKTYNDIKFQEMGKYND